jgi:hypothetical protein
MGERSHQAFDFHLVGDGPVIGQVEDAPVWPASGVFEQGYGLAAASDGIDFEQ